MGEKSLVVCWKWAEGWSGAELWEEIGRSQAQESEGPYFGSQRESFRFPVGVASSESKSRGHRLAASPRGKLWFVSLGFEASARESAGRCVEAARSDSTDEGAEAYKQSAFAFLPQAQM